MEMDDGKPFESWKGSRWGPRSTRQRNCPWLREVRYNEKTLQSEGGSEIKGAKGISYNEWHLSELIDNMGWRGTLFLAVRARAGFVILRG